MVIISESDGATLDSKRCDSGGLGMRLSAQRLLVDRNERDDNVLKAFKREVRRCLMLASEPEGARMVVPVEVCDRK